MNKGMIQQPENKIRASRTRVLVVGGRRAVNGIRTSYAYAGELHVYTLDALQALGTGRNTTVLEASRVLCLRSL